MEWIFALIIEIVVQGDALMRVTMNKSLKQVVQEYICRKEFEEARPDFEKASWIDDPVARFNALDKVRTQVLIRCGVKP